MTAKELEEKHQLVIQLPKECGVVTSIVVDEGVLYAITSTDKVIQLLRHANGQFVGCEL